MTISRVRTILSGDQVVGSGVSDLYFLASAGDEQQMVSAVALFWTDLADNLAAGNSADVEGTVTSFNEATGDIVAVDAVATDPPVIPFTATAEPLPTATQGLVQWRTNGIVNNRNVRGRMFIPAQTSAANQDGRPVAGAIAQYLAAAQALLTGGDEQLVIWARPTPERVGTSHTVTSATIWSQWAVLRSRRD